MWQTNLSGTNLGRRWQFRALRGRGSGMSRAIPAVSTKPNKKASLAAMPIS